MVFIHLIRDQIILQWPSFFSGVMVFEPVVVLRLKGGLLLLEHRLSNIRLHLGTIDPPSLVLDVRAKELEVDQSYHNARQGQPK
jgi:hypothetical protein